MAGAVRAAVPRPRPRPTGWPIRTPSRSWPAVMVNRLELARVRVRVVARAVVLVVVRDLDRVLVRVPVVRVLGWVLALVVPVSRWVVRPQPDSLHRQRAPAQASADPVQVLAAPEG